MRQNVCKVSREIYSPEDAEMEMFYGYKLGNYCWDKCYDLRSIRDNKIMFDTSLKIGEDTAFVNEYVRKSKKVICLDQKNYVHIVNDQSVMENLYRDNAWKSLYESICVSKSILETSKSSKANKAILAAVVQAEEHLLRIMCVKNVTGEIYDGELKSFKKNYLSVVLDPRIDVRQRIKVLMMGINPFNPIIERRILNNKKAFIANIEKKYGLDISHLTEECRIHEQHIGRPVVFTEQTVSEVINAYDKILIEASCIIKSVDVEI